MNKSTFGKTFLPGTRTNDVVPLIKLLLMILFIKLSLTRAVTSGIVNNKPISELTTEGFVPCYDVTYETPTTSVALTAACNLYPSRYLFVGSKSSNTATLVSL